MEAPPLLTAALAVAVLAFGSGFLHLDGLADTADGLAVQGDRGRRLEVMRRGDVGPVGVVALVLVLLVQVSALAGLLAARCGSAAATLCLAVVASRATLVVACARGVPPARADGLGSGVAGSVPPALAAVVVGAVAVVAGLVDQWRGVAGVAVATAAAVVLVVRGPAPDRRRHRGCSRCVRGARPRRLPGQPGGRDRVSRPRSVVPVPSR